MSCSESVTMDQKALEDLIKVAFARERGQGVVSIKWTIRGEVRDYLGYSPPKLNAEIAWEPLIG